ncbi:structural maintenance of chromosomes protein [Ureaplasma urealyticum]|uniref:Structural maintenance of chromosomes protein n=1 Tax=Ureaplasma urealyticum TaxID=2130 RepID=A0ABD4SND9_UREUR|nr:structural maintenance of chromosomes protein [Ureaplasma urealyticum]MCF1349047.1 structural maintenance of chromosomes protein [Ureaplasma urealyticum]
MKGYKWIYVNERENKTIEEIEHEIWLLNDQARIYDKYKDREWINHSSPITKEDIDYYFEFNSKLTKDKNDKPLSEDEIKKLKEEEFKRAIEDYKIKTKIDYWIVLMYVLDDVDKPRAKKNWAPFNQKNENNEYVWTEQELRTLIDESSSIAGKASTNAKELDYIFGKKVKSVDDRKVVMRGIAKDLDKIRSKINNELERRENESIKQK